MEHAARLFYLYKTFFPIPISTLWSRFRYFPINHTPYLSNGRSHKIRNIRQKFSFNIIPFLKHSFHLYKVGFSTFSTRYPLYSFEEWPKYGTYGKILPFIIRSFQYSFELWKGFLDIFPINHPPYVATKYGTMQVFFKHKTSNILLTLYEANFPTF